MNNIRQYEKDERQRLLKIVEDMNLLHANMGGRDSRPERETLMRCMKIITREIERDPQRS